MWCFLDNSICAADNAAQLLACKQGRLLAAVTALEAHHEMLPKLGLMSR